MPQTTFRSDVVAAHLTILHAQQTATPDQLRKVYSARPGGIGETPFAFVGERSETISHGSQLRTRTMTGMTVWICDTFVDASETEDRLDDLVDLLVERYTAAYAAVPGGGGLLQMSSAADSEISFASSAGVTTTLRAVVFGFPDTFITEGRA